MRDNWYMGGNKEETVNLFKKVGFSTVYAWYITVAYPCNHFEQLARLYFESPFMISMRNKCKNKEQIQKIENMLVNGIKNVVNSILDQNTPLIHDIMCIVAIKNE